MNIIANSDERGGKVASSTVALTVAQSKVALTEIRSQKIAAITESGAMQESL